MDLDKGAILARTKRTVKVIETPDGTMYVRSLKVGEKDDFEAGNFAVVDGKPELNLKEHSARLAALTVCDRDGNRLFNDLDAAQLTHLDAAFLEPVIDAAKRLNGMLPDAARGNSPTTPSDASG